MEYIHTLPAEKRYFRNISGVEISLSFSYICFFFNSSLVESHEIVTLQDTLSAHIFLANSTTYRM